MQVASTLFSFVVFAPFAPCGLLLCSVVVIASAKRQDLPFAVKLEIINRVKSGEKSDIAVMHKIPRSTLSTILKNEAEIRG